MAKYDIYTARLVYNKYNKLKGSVNAESLDEVKELIKKPINEGGFFLNPFYAVIVEITEKTSKIVHNRHLEFCVEK